jgi:light-regulated signal transduction histidine kinase (bacteriophytochrome)
MASPSKSNRNHTVQQLRDENQRLRNELERVQRQATALVQAQAEAAERMAQLDAVNEALQREIDRCSVSEPWRQAVGEDGNAEIERRLMSLRKANDVLAAEVTSCQTEEREHVKLLRKLENANRELTEFAYIVSHDLKAPLRGIKTLAGWIVSDCRDKLDDEGKQHLDLLVDRIDRIENLIRGILNYSRAGRMGEHGEWVDLNELLPPIIDMIAPSESVVVTVQDSLPTVHCERTRMTQVFQNLISNAVKYQDKPQGHVAIAYEDQGDRWVFRVVDNGLGIEERHHESIFKIFYTLASRDEMESTGIGLAVVRKVVGLYGGEVWLESAFGEGSTFYFSWPKNLDPAEHIDDTGQD